MVLFALLPAFATAATVLGRHDPSLKITVCLTPDCDFPTIQSAVNSINPMSKTAHSIYIFKGTYKEQVMIPELSSQLRIYGETSDPSSYTNNVVNLEWECSKASGAPTDQATSALINLSANTSIYNINIRNTYGKDSQAVALSAYNTRQAYYGVALYGYQNTLLEQVGTHFYGQCYVQGANDIIYGKKARMWMTRTTIAVSDAGFITASGRNSSDDNSYYVIDQSNVYLAKGASVTPGTVYLGHPWGEHARVCVQGVSLPDMVNEAGWKPWSPTQPNTAHAIFQEYNNVGPGATGRRAPYAIKLTQSINIATILGKDYETWVDDAYT